MTRTLILMRHAKSSWDDPALDDFDRSLNARGRASATSIGKWLNSNGYQPDAAIVSAAQRTQETYTLTAAELTKTIDVTFTPALDLAGADLILKTVQNQTGQSLLVICHNPGIADFANRITKSPAGHARFFDYPTAATTIIEFQVDSWQDISWKSGTANDFIVPRELDT